MAPYLKRSTTRLPQSLLEEIQQNDQNNSGSWNSKNSRKRSLSRKEGRRQRRADQKQNKALFFSTNRKRRAEDEHSHNDSLSPKKARIDSATLASNTLVRLGSTSGNSTTRKNIKSRQNNISRTTKDKRTQNGREDNAREKGKEQGKAITVPLPRSRVEEEEDAYIVYLEKKLGYGKVKHNIKKDSFEEDGLDDLLDWADTLGFPTTVHSRGRYDVSKASQTSVQSDQIPDDQNTEFSGDVEESDLASGGESLGSEEDEDEVSGDLGDEGEWVGITLSKDDETDIEETGSMEGNDAVEDTGSQSQLQTATAMRYVPPHLRKKQDEPDSEAITRLKKQLKGLLNRMSEQNLSSIVDNFEGLYRNNRRHDVTSSITNLVIEGVSSHSILLDSYVVLHAALISSLHKIIGTEFAAYFLQNVVKDYESHRKELQVSETAAHDEPQLQTQGSEAKGKECSNLMVLLSELYNFQVISSALVFDLIRQLLEDDLTEYNIGLLLKLMRNSGQQLRQDDPSALKDIIDIVQKKVSGRDEKSLSSRTRFMIETLVNLKNNKLKRNVTQNQGGEAVERMKKFLASLSKRKHVLAHDAIRVSLDDLHSAESRGKWWLVGAAWGGNPLVEAQESMADVQVNGRDVPSVNEATGDLLKLARKQGMNTDIRRSIFVILMSSDDYIDACERLSQLNLTEVQQREIVRVLLHCCGNEKTYNPYYALVCQQLCRQSHSYKITLQFCLWDFLRDMGEATVGGAEVVKNARNGDAGFDLKKISSSRMRNVAKAYAWWIAKDVVNLSVLKAVDFTVLKPQSQQFLRELLLQTLISSQSTTPITDLSQLPTMRNRAAIEEVFVKATRIENLAMGLVYFLANVFLKCTYDDDTVAKFVKWANGLALDTLRTGVDIIPSL